MLSGGMANFQIQYTRDRHALPLTRGYMGEVEAGLMEQKGTECEVPNIRENALLSHLALASRANIIER